MTMTPANSAPHALAPSLRAKAAVADGGSNARCPAAPRRDNPYSNRRGAALRTVGRRHARPAAKTWSRPRRRASIAIADQSAWGSSALTSTGLRRLRDRLPRADADDCVSSNSSGVIGADDGCCSARQAGGAAALRLATSETNSADGGWVLLWRRHTHARPGSMACAQPAPSPRFAAWLVRPPA